MDSGTGAPTNADQGESDPISQAGSTPDSVTVNAGAQTPQPETQNPTVNAQVPTTPTPMAPTVLVKQHRGGLAGIVDEFRDAVAGTTGRGVYINPDTGERFVSHPDLTGKQQWMKLAGEALTGATAGFAAGHGAGNMAKAPFAGVQAQLQKQQQQNQTQDQQAEQDYQRDKEAKLAKANSQLLATQVASNQFKLQRMGVEATQQDVKFSEDQDQYEHDHGSVDLGTYDFDNLHEVQAHVPDFWKQHYAENTIRAIPAYDADGKRIGIHLWQRQPGIGDQPVPEGTQVRIFKTPGPGEKPTWEPLTLSGTPSRNEVDAYQATQDKKYQDWQLAQQKAAQATSEIQKNLSEVPKNKAETANAYSEAGEHKAQTEALNQATGPAALEASSRGLVEGTMDPSQLSKRSKDYDARLAAANAYSMQTTGKPFDIAKASADYKFATQKGTTDTLNYLNSLTGRDNASGNLQKVVELSKQVGNTQFPAINKVAQWAKLEAGNSTVAAYHAALLETSDQIAKILSGSSSGGTSDKKLRDSQGLLDQDFNSGQIAAVADKTLRPLLANRKQEIIGDNRYLRRWHPQPQGNANGITVTAPNGKAYQFKDQQSADAFKKNAGIQ
jgi:hypothetical protein